MVDRIRSVDFLPEIFRTDTNRKFLNATLDQVVQEPRLRRIQGFIGRRIGSQSDDGYVVEIDKTRGDYQLEPAVIFRNPSDKKINDAVTYPGILDTISNNNGFVDKQDRLWKGEYYSWDPFIDFDKFTNFGEYYWLPQGPDPVDVSARIVATSDSYTVTRTASGFKLSDLSNENPVLTLVRGGNYTFEVNDPNRPFWIQSAPGVDGVLPTAQNISSRDVLGVVNNGEDSGTITFRVPLKDAQSFYYQLNDKGTVDLVTNLKFSDINNKYVDVLVEQYGGIDGLTDLNNRTIIFLSRIDDTQDGGWEIESQFDINPFDTLTYSQTDAITSQDDRYSIWQIQYVYDTDDRPYIKLVKNTATTRDDKVQVEFGAQYSSRGFYRSADGYWQEIPLLTAAQDTLYYQDPIDPALFGRINLIDQEGIEDININDIVGQINYTSPNGVVFTNGLKVQFRGRTVPSEYQDQTYYVEGVGSSIVLLPTLDFITPETYTSSASEPYDSIGYDQGGFDSTLNAPETPDYITINRADLSRNAWARSNRWFHSDVINVTAEYNNSIAVLNQDYRAKRPIIEFRPNLRLFNSGTAKVDPVDIIDFRQQDALSNVNGQIGYSVDGYSLVDGTRIIFAADTDALVRNKIYRVNFIDPNNDGTFTINLTPDTDAQVLTDQLVVIKSGITSQGKSYRYDGSTWVLAQQKSSVNQFPLFDIFDSNNRSLSDRDIYPSSTFIGTNLFGYRLGTGTPDTVLGFALSYLNINNVGDIIFDNYFYNDEFTYVVDGISSTKKISLGHVREYSNRVDYSKKIGWQKSIAEVNNRQVFNFVYDGTALTLDVRPKENYSIPTVRVYVNGEFVPPTRYTVVSSQSDISSTITFTTQPALNSQITVRVISDDVSQQGYYSIPTNLEKNPLNSNSEYYTLGSIRRHYQTVAENLSNFAGIINGSNNIRDLGNVLVYGEEIVQQSAPVIIPGALMRDARLNLFNAIEYNSREYEKFKNLLMDAVYKADTYNKSIPTILDEALTSINVNKSLSSAFYWSDCLPGTSNYTTTTYTITPISDNKYNLIRSYDFSKANYQSVLVYLNDALLIKDRDYQIESAAPVLTLLATTAVGDRVTIREYSDTSGTYCPSTPTKLGLYQKYIPLKYLDDTYVTPITVIQGHDGSITAGFGDIRDDVLLEFETRIYNNLKVNTSVPVDANDILGGKFYTTDYSLSELNEIFSIDFLSWVGANRLDYKTQTYLADNEYTWNYSQCNSVLNDDLLLGNWRGIYRYFYDTEYPHTKPWEMLGLTEKPSWWDDEYGSAPYTSGNLVLWEDLENGIVKDPAGAYTINRYKRPGLTKVIPVDSEGNLLSPYQCIVKDFDQLNFRRSWVMGDVGPVEHAWRSSSHWPFAVMKMLYLTQPAKFASYNIDRDRYRYEVDFDQFLLDNRYRLDITDLQIYGSGTAKHSYLNWIVDYNVQFGIDTQKVVNDVLSNLGVQLAWRTAGFTDKKFIKLLIEKSSPGSTNTSLLIPDESFKLDLYKNQPLERLVFSSVIVQRTTDGWAVSGYSIDKPYFEIVSSLVNGNYSIFTVNGKNYRIPKDFGDKIVRVPYGYVFTTREGVVDFLNSYGERLRRQGMVFDEVESGYILNWDRMAQEFVAWTTQGFGVNAVINLNPAANKLRIIKDFVVADTLNNSLKKTQILNQDRKILNNSQLIINRIDNEISVETTTSDTINYLVVDFVSYEQILIVDNSTVFNDLVYDPVLGVRQTRIQVNGWITFDWNGQLDAQGFIFNQDNVEEWSPNKKYTRGQYVKYKDSYWSASEIIEPSETFDFSKWLKSDYNKINKGLLPNMATKSNQLSQAYDRYTANLESDIDLLGFGISGFRPRQYMRDINLDDVSQFNVYSNFLGTKGSRNATDLFADISTGKENATYEIFENWAIKRADYGATANRNYIEIKLNEDVLNSNPGLVQIKNTGESSLADLSVDFNKVYKTSKPLTTSSIFYTTRIQPTDISLPSAGYVNIDDVDISVFSVDNLDAINQRLTDLRVGSVIWVAKDENYFNSQDWNIYRACACDAKIVSVTDNLDGTSVVKFNKPHGIVAGDLIAIRFFDNDVDGAYRTISVPSLTKLVIDYQIPGTNQTEIVGDGTVFKLESCRVAQPSDISSLSFVKNIRGGDVVWTDSRAGSWAVYEKQSPFTYYDAKNPQTLVNNQEFGTSVAQSYNNVTAVIGAPGAGQSSGRGALYCYSRSSDDVYVLSDTVSPNVTGLTGLGNSIEIGQQDWIVAGASNSDSGRGYALVLYWSPSTNTFQPWQWLMPEVGVGSSNEFGYSVTMSYDEKWIYVGEPGENTVHAFGRVDLPTQELSFISNGVRIDFQIDNTIEVTSADQLLVQINGSPTTSFSYEDGVVRLIGGAPAVGAVIDISRRTAISELGDGSTDAFSLDNLFTVSNIYSFRALINGVLQRPGYDYTYDSGTNEVVFLSAPAADAEILLQSTMSYWQLCDTISPAGLTTERFGHSLACTTDGRQLVVGTPREIVDTKTAAGTTRIYDRSVERFIVDTAVKSAGSVQVKRSVAAPVSVHLNGRQLTNSDIYINGEYTVSGTTITFNTTINVGDVIEVDTNTFSLIQKINAASPSANANFGHAVDQCTTNCSVYVGAPYDNTFVPQGGSVDRFGNQTRLYGVITGTQTNPTLTAGHSIRINNIDVIATGTTVTSFATDINDAGIDNVQATVANGKLTISLINSAAGLRFEKLLVLPGLGTAFSDLGLEPYQHFQTIQNPANEDYAYFGSTVIIDTSADNLVIGAPNGSARMITSIDAGATTFDGDSLTFTDINLRTGVVFTFDLLPSNGTTADDPSKFAFGQEIYFTGLTAQSKFGSGISYTTDRLLIGASGFTNVSNNTSYIASGKFYEWDNPDHTLAWTVKRQQQPVVDISLINGGYVYDSRDSKVTEYLDYIDPLQGKILGSVQQNLDYISGSDPAAYNNGSVNNYGGMWGKEHLGEIWWNTTNARFLDYNQNDIEYASRRWGQLFPGSTIDVYQWIESSTPPQSYQGPGQPLNVTSYTTVTSLDSQNVFSTKYYFWVTGIDSVQSNKTLSLTTIQQYLTDPTTSGIPYMAIVDSRTMALYNYINGVIAQDTILSIEYSVSKNSDNVHSEYELITDGDPNNFLSDDIFNKLIDSLSGSDRLGKNVPDPSLPLSDSYGIKVRPRQSMFVDRFAGLKNYIVRANAKCALYPLRESRRLTLLSSKETPPNELSGQWDARVADLTELGYQDLRLVPVGYRYLVDSDSSNQNLWAIYSKNASGTLDLVRVQTYDTTKFWNYVDWYREGYNPLTVISQEVATYSDLLSTTKLESKVVKVTANSSGLWEIYQVVNGDWQRQALEKGTISISSNIYEYSSGRYGFDVEVFDGQYFDQYPTIETRNILRSINEEIFVEDLALIRKELLILMFEYILSEQKAPDWLFKTSLVDVNHRIRDLLPYRVYNRDNQDFVKSYLEEVKPFHVKIKEFKLSYDAIDTNNNNVADFDLPAYYDASTERFISPILDNRETPLDPYSSKTSSDVIWSTLPWKQWYDNYLLSIESVTLISGGSGYTDVPSVTVSGAIAERDARLRAVINSAGSVTSIVIEDPGLNYQGSITLTIEGGNGSGAKAVAVLGNGLVRQIKTTIKYDRCEYVSSVVDWSPNTLYPVGQLVRYQGKVYRAIVDDSSLTVASGLTFGLENFVIVPDDQLSGSDRVMGLYAPTVNQIGLDLALLVNGIDYPGVQVSGPLFSQNSGFDVGNFDINPFDNLEYGAEGLPTYDGRILDTILSSEFTDIFLGTRATDINVEGGGFVDTYSSHAPEELMPGSMFDTLDLKVFTRPGADWSGNGYGFLWRSKGFVYINGQDTYEWDNIVENPAAVFLTNITDGKVLAPGHDFTINWTARTLTITSGVTGGDSFVIEVLSVGGGNQLLRRSVSGSTFSGRNYVIPLKSSEISSVLVFVNGIIDTGATFAAADSVNTNVIVSVAPDSTDFINLVVFGSSDYTWCVPIYEKFTGDGSTLNFTLSQAPVYRNASNLFVFVEGRRLRPPESIEIEYDGSDIDFLLPTTGGTNQALIADNEVKLFRGETELQYGVDFVLTPADGSSTRSVATTESYRTANPLVAGEKFTITVWTDADYTFNGAELTIRNVSAPIAGTSILVVSFNDTREQQLLTQVFLGPTALDTLAVEPFDQVGYDSANGFDYSEAITVSRVFFDTGRVIEDPRRLFVTINGRRIFSDIDWVADGTRVVLTGTTVLNTDVVVITSFTQNVVPDNMAYRIFVDMLGNRGIYRIHELGTTTLVRDIDYNDDVIYLLDASTVPNPDPELNQLGFIMVNNERISYRERNLVDNTISGLRRGTGGTAITYHNNGSTVYDISAGQRLPTTYQDYISAQTLAGDGSTKFFATSNVKIESGDSSIYGTPVQVFVGGRLLDSSEFTVDETDPVAVTLDEAPGSGVVVVISIRKGYSLYGNIDGVALQEIDNSATRFLNE